MTQIHDTDHLDAGVPNGRMRLRENELIIRDMIQEAEESPFGKVTRLPDGRVCINYSVKNAKDQE